jgi:hypothetical protein
MKKESKYKFTSKEPLKKLRDYLTDVSYENGEEEFTYTVPKTMFMEAREAGGTFDKEVKK